MLLHSLPLCLRSTNVAPYERARVQIWGVLNLNREESSKFKQAEDAQVHFLLYLCNAAAQMAYGKPTIV